MKENFIETIKEQLIGTIAHEQIVKIERILYSCLLNFEIQEKVSADNAENLKVEKYLQMFLSAKRIEGCSEKTIKYYYTTLIPMLNSIEKTIENITTEDLRGYLACYQIERQISKVTLDNIRRIFSSFFAWLEDEDYIIKSPVRRIHKVKEDKIIKEILSDENMELLRDSCVEIRDLALIDILNSTGIRVGELEKLDISDIDFHNRECIVFGKGNKQRTVYFDAKAKVHITKYLQSRVDDNPALFVSLKAPYNRLKIGGIQCCIRKLGKAASVKKIYPHKFRRTMATAAIDKGMPIEQVQRLLGHVKIDTTMHYAIVNQNNVKISHRKYIS